MHALTDALGRGPPALFKAQIAQPLLQLGERSSLRNTFQAVFCGRQGAPEVITSQSAVGTLYGTRGGTCSRPRSSGRTLYMRLFRSKETTLGGDFDRALSISIF